MRIRPRSCKNSYNRKKDCLIDIYYGDESHICTEGYVPYGWQFRGEDVYIPSERGLRLNIFGMIDRNNRYEGFSTTENMTADKVADFLDRFSLRIRKNTFVVLDNASVHRCKLMRELRPIWEKRGLYLFFLPPYSPHLNIAETLGESSRANGSDLRIIAPQNPCSMQLTVRWLRLDLNSISILSMRLSIN